MAAISKQSAAEFFNPMRKGIVTICVVGFVVGVLPSAAMACSCAGPSSSLSIRTAAVVFTGTVASIERPVMPPPQVNVNPDGTLASTFEVSRRSSVIFEAARVFQGSPARRIVIESYATTCDFVFKPGETWLVYAYSQNNELITHRCTRTRLYDRAAEDLRFLQGLQENRRQGIVYGSAFRRIVAVGGTSVLTLMPDPDRFEIIAVGGQERFTVTIDDASISRDSYQIVLPPGNFEIWIERLGRPVSARTAVHVEHGEQQVVNLIAEYQ